MKKYSCEAPYGQNSSIRIAILANDDLEFYKNNKLFQKHLKQNRIGISGNELWAWDYDTYIRKLYGN